MVTSSVDQSGAPGDAGSGGRAPGRSLSGSALRRAWVGYRRRLDAELADAGFADFRLPDGRVLRLCAASPTVTSSQIGRELGISRQAAGKLVASLNDRGYVTLEPSSSDGREKIIRPTPRAIDLLRAHRTAARGVEERLRSQFGPDRVDDVRQVLAALGGEEQPRMRDYLRRNIDARDWA